MTHNIIHGQGHANQNNEELLYIHGSGKTEEPKQLNVGKDVGKKKGNFYTVLEGVETAQLLYSTLQQYLQSSRCTYPVTQQFYLYTSQKNSHDIHKNVTSLIKNWKQPKCPITVKWITFYIYLFLFLQWNNIQQLKGIN